MRLSNRAKANLFLVGSGLIVAHFRYLVQYGRLPYESMWEFFGSWLIHYFWLAFAIMFANLAYTYIAPMVLGSSHRFKELEISEAIIMFGVAILAAIVFASIISFWPQGG